MSRALGAQYITREALARVAKKNRVSEIFVEETMSAIVSNKNFLKIDDNKKIKGKRIVSISDEKTLLILNYTSEVLKKISHAKQSNRDRIVKSVIQLLNETTEKYIYRLDIRKFYESIHQENIYNKIFSDKELSPITKRIVRYYLDKLATKEIKGVGRGVSLSASLAEYYLRDFDERIRSTEGVYYYSRFVDDIILFSSKKIVNVVEFIENSLPSELKLNNSKEKYSEVEIKDQESKKFVYLGYQFEANIKKIINIDIANGKVNKIKNRLAKSFISYSLDKNEKLLIKRLKYLSGNRVVTLRNGTTFRTGLFYSYKYINKDDSASLKSIDTYYKSILFSKRFRLFKENVLTSLKKNNYHFIRNLSFHDSFLSIPIYNISDEKEVKRCWLHA